MSPDNAPRFDTPVLFIIFNRPETTQKVFDTIREIKPLNLYVAADGAREGNDSDLIRCKQTRAIIDQVDWLCNIHKLFRDKNVGCKAGVSSAIDWFFEQVEEGIILEDDCVPDPSFYSFCRTMLERYRSEDKVMMVSGTSFVPEAERFPESYYFSRYVIIWGWATWKRAWKRYDIHMKSWPSYRDARKLEKVYPIRAFALEQERLFQHIFEGQGDTWDIQWVFSCIYNDGFAIMPKYNLISNLGFVGSHSTGASAQLHGRPTTALDVRSLVHPNRIAEDRRIDESVIRVGMQRFGNRHFMDRFSIVAMIDFSYRLLNTINPHRWRYGLFHRQ